MARGWESKSVEAQLEEGKERPADHPRTSLEQRAVQGKLESLRLSRARLLQQLETARHPAHREILQNGLRAIEQQIDEVTDDRHRQLRA
jgi:hypothetical protein